MPKVVERATPSQNHAADLVARAAQYIPELFPQYLPKFQGESAAHISLRYPARMRMLRSLEEAAGSDNASELDSMHRWLEIQNRYASFLVLHQRELAAGAFLDSRSHVQHSIYESIFEFIEAGNDLGYVLAATGIGKSVVMARILEATGGRAIIITPKIDIFDSIIASLRTFAPSVRWGRVDKDHKDFDADVILTTGQSFLAHASGAFQQNAPDWILIDEVDFAATEKRDEALAHFPKAQKIGFTGTDYERRQGMGERICSFTLPDAIRQGLAAPVLPVLIHTRVDVSKASTRSGDYDPETLDRVIRAADIEHTPAEVYLELCYRSETDFDPAVCFVATNNQADRVRDKFLERGVKAVSLHSNVSDEENAATYEQLRKGSLPVVVAVRKPVRGVDIPSLAWIFNFTPTTQPTLLAQKIGRVIRLDPHNPAKIGVSVDWVYERSGMGAQVLTPQLLEDVLELAIARNELLGHQIIDADALRQLKAKDIQVIVEITQLQEFIRSRLKDIRQQVKKMLVSDKDWVLSVHGEDNFGPMARLARAVIGAFAPNYDNTMKTHKVGDSEVAHQYHPRLVQLITETFVPILPPPEGYVSIYELVARVFGKGISTKSPKVARILDMAQKRVVKRFGESVELSGLYRSGNGQVVRHYSGKVMTEFKAIHAEVLRNTNNPNLIGIRELAEILHRKDDSVRQQITRLVSEGKIEQPQTWLGYTRQQHICELYHRAKILEILKDFKAQSIEPEVDLKDWVSLTSKLQTEHHVDRRSLLLFVDQHNLRRVMPHWFKSMPNPSGRNDVPYVHVDLIQFYKKMIREVMRAYDGCHTATSLAQSLNVAGHRILATIREIRAEDPSFVPTRMTNEHNVPYNYFDPRQVKIILERYEQIKAERKWS